MDLEQPFDIHYEEYLVDKRKFWAKQKTEIQQLFKTGENNIVLNKQ